MGNTDSALWLPAHTSTSKSTPSSSSSFNSNSTTPTTTIPSLQSLSDTDKQSNERLQTHISQDLPHHIFERKLTPTSGRFSSTYRIRHQDSGAVMLLKVVLLPVQSLTNDGTSSGGGSGSGSGGAHAGAGGTTASAGGGAGGESQQQQTQSHATGPKRSHAPQSSSSSSTPTNITTAATTTTSTTTTTQIQPHRSSTNLTTQQKELTHLLSIQSTSHPHLLSYTYSIGSPTFSVTNQNHTLYKPIYLLRPHTYSTLSQRIVTRPFLSNAEKMFLAHQILHAVQRLHENNVCHGHLTCENVGLSSWNWVVLLDVLPNGRPTFLAEDDPSDWIYYFQSRDEVGIGAVGSGGGAGGGIGIGAGGAGAGTPGTGAGAGGAAGVHANELYIAKSQSGGSNVGPGMHAGMGGGADGNGGEKRCYLAPERFVKREQGDASSGTNTGIRNDASSKDADPSTTRATATGTGNRNPIPRSDPGSSSSNSGGGGGGAGGGMTLTPAMDIFSLGCVLMELFLNGEPAMDLGDLMEYRQNANGAIMEHSTLPQRLNKIESGNMRAAVRHMLHLDPKKRLSAGEYLKRLTEEKETVAGVSGVSGSTKDGKSKTAEGGDKQASIKDKTSGQSSSASGGGAAAAAGGAGKHHQTPPLPPCHASVLLPLFQRVRCEVLSPDARIALAAISYGKVVRETVGMEDRAGEAFFRRVVGPTMIGLYDEEGEDGETSPPEADRQGKGGSGSGSGSGNTVPDDHDNATSMTKNPVSKDDESGETFTVKNPSSEFDLFDPFRKDGDLGYDDLLAQTERLLLEIESNRGNAMDCASEDEKKEDKRPTDDTNDGAEHVFSNVSLRDLPQTPSSAALVIFVQFILSTIRHAQRPSSKLVGMQLLLRLAKFSTDGVRLQRIVPTLISILNDSDACVRSMAVTVLTAVLAMIEHFPPSDAQAFPQYILKRVAHLMNDHVIMVRLAFVECMAQLAETALRFLDTCHAIKLYETVDGDGGSLSDDDSPSKAMNHAMTHVESAFGDDAAKLLGSPDSRKSHSDQLGGNDKKGGKDDGGFHDVTSLIRDEYNKDLGELQETFARWVVSVTTDISDHASALKQAILKDIARLCQFFGNEGVMTCILPQILAFLNHRKDWQLRASLCRHLPSVCAIVGRAATEQFVVPCVETALIDDEDVVVSSALQCLASLVQMGLLNRVVLLGNNIKRRGDDGVLTNKSNLGILKKYCALLVHPSDDIRHAASFLFATCFRTIGFPDDEVHIMPIMRPFLRYDVDRSAMLDTEGILSSLIPSLEESDFAGDADPEKFVDIGENRADQEHLQSFNDNMKYYLSMSKRGQKRNQDREWSDGLRILQDVIEEQQKASFSVYLPNQKYAELITKPLPEWYEHLRRIASDRKPFESEVSALRTMSILSKVYALTILQPPHSVQPQKMWKGDFMTLDLGFEHFLSDEKEAEENLKSILSSKESKAFTGSSKGEWGSTSLVDPVSMEMSQFISKLVSVKAPVIPPRLGPLRDVDGRLYSSHAPARPPAQPAAPTTVRRAEWKPKVDVLLCSTSPLEHKGPVTRLAISQDQTFFVSGSHDGTCKVFETHQIRESNGGLKSCLTVGGESTGAPGDSNMRVNDLSIIENSHSVASGNSDGLIQVWRVDVISKEPQIKSTTSSAVMNTSAISSRFSRVSGYKMLRKVEAHEGEISAVSHFNTNSASIVTFASQMCVHSWDLRCAEEPFVMPSRPDFGYLSSMAIGNDRNWLVTGTNLGIVALWDIRFQKCVKTWQHSSGAPINRLGTSFASLSRTGSPTPHIVIGCGLNETSIFDISAGSCRQCFRVLDPSLCYIERSSLPAQCTSLPSLKEIRLSSNLSRKLAGVNSAMDSMMSSRVAPPQPNVQAFNGRVGSSGLNYLVTGGTDGFLRYWDFNSASKCFTISGLRHSQPRPVFESINCGSGRVTLCRQLQSPKTSEVSTAFLPKANQSGPVRPENRHRDAILDIKRLDYPMKGLITSSRDGIVKVWR